MLLEIISHAAASGLTLLFSRKKTKLALAQQQIEFEKTKADIAHTELQNYDQAIKIWRDLALDLRKELVNVSKECAQFRAECVELKKECVELREECSSLKGEVGKLRKENAQLKTNMEHLERSLKNAAQ